MKRRRALCVGIATAAVLSFGSIAQATPDFSGKWSIVPSRAATGVTNGASPPSLSAQGDMGSGWGDHITITQDGSLLTVAYAKFHPRDLQPQITFRFLLNELETRNTSYDGQGHKEIMTRGRWEGDQLLLITRRQFINPENGQTVPYEITQGLSLQSPDTLLVNVTRPGVLGGKLTTTSSVYKKENQ